ncbi:MAG TPA: alpha-ketoglutarate-dependent dioxygenase AlkB [Acidimicrobiales bacterium]|nr:alpha-ketoglutarate-dependent dioxygenase AlkB [Acidimicrobiales bacterium]
MAPLVRQPSLLDGGPPRLDASFATARRRDLGRGAWIDEAPGWVAGADQLFDEIAAAAPWAAHERPMYDRVVDVPRLVTGRWEAPPEPIPAAARLLGERYGLDLSAVSANLYRDGADSVAWHGDRIGRVRRVTVVALVILGEPRRFLLRPTGGGPSIALDPGPGDLLVLGGTCQTTFEHCVPKRAHAGPRISVMFREPVDV